ncbi:MAG TPA: hypothetical protein VI685_03900, partial [Candidatus Angelobacter sp.]
IGTPEKTRGVLISSGTKFLFQQMKVRHFTTIFAVERQKARRAMPGESAAFSTANKRESICLQ